MEPVIVLSQSDKRPIYLQIIEQIKRRIAVGDWTEGHPLPSIRQLAVDLQVSVITVKRAYLELEREGVIVTQQGKGSRVTATAGIGLRLQHEELQKHLEHVARLSAVLGLKQKELESRLREASDAIAAKERS
ncbi:MAG TPA: GntR family transcriptional regulator [Terriglobia bacterium]|nr:GntR family transcriptional regulator [Terriglobia bacterium]